MPYRRVPNPRRAVVNGFRRVPDVPDRLNPLARAYATAMLARHGVHVNPGEDPTAMWRNLSQAIAAQRHAEDQARAARARAQLESLNGPDQIGPPIAPPAQPQSPYGFGYAGGQQLPAGPPAGAFTAPRLTPILPPWMRAQ